MGAIKDIPALYRPREKARRDGIKSLSDEELLSLIIGSGVKGHSALDIAREMLYGMGGLDGLFRCDIDSLMDSDGISEATALRLQACFEIAGRSGGRDPRFDAEELRLYCFSASLRPLGHTILCHSLGDSLSLDPAVVAKEAVRKGAASVMLVHTHPSGDPLPSKSDIEFTLAARSRLSSLSIKLIDHLIRADGRQFSFRSAGIL